MASPLYSCNQESMWVCGVMSNELVCLMATLSLCRWMKTRDLFPHVSHYISLHFRRSVCACGSGPSSKRGPCVLVCDVSESALAGNRFRPYIFTCQIVFLFSNIRGGTQEATYTWFFLKNTECKIYSDMIWVAAHTTSVISKAYDSHGCFIFVAFCQR